MIHMDAARFWRLNGRQIWLLLLSHLPLADSQYHSFLHATFCIFMKDTKVKIVIIYENSATLFYL